MVGSQKSIGGVVVALGNAPYSLGVAIAVFNVDLEGLFKLSQCLGDLPNW
jgi:hypothetical protein